MSRIVERPPHVRPRRSSRHPRRERHPGQMIVLPRCCSVSKRSRPQSGHANLRMMPARSCHGSPQAGHSPRSPSGAGTIGPSYPQATQTVSPAVIGDSDEGGAPTQEAINSSDAAGAGFAKPHAGHVTSASSHPASHAGQVTWVSMTCSSLWRRESMLTLHLYDLADKPPLVPWPAPAADLQLRGVVADGEGLPVIPMRRPASPRPESAPPGGRISRPARGASAGLPGRSGLSRCASSLLPDQPARFKGR